MESIGEKLRLTRERNNLTVDQVARDTHVAKRFLKALEDEDFSVFPGETYALGFLRNYAEYLGLDPEELIGIYRNLKIQEQPLPMNELLEARPKIPRILLVVAIVVGIVVLAGAAYLIYRAASHPAAQSSVSVTPAAAGAEYVFDAEASVRTRWFNQGDVISVAFSGKTYRIEVGKVNSSLTLKVPGGTVDMTLGSERFIDLDGDSKPDLRVVWNDADRTSPTPRVNLGLYRTTAQAADAAATAAADAADTSVPAAAPAAPAAAAQTPAVRPATPQPVTVTRAADTSLFTLDFTFKNDCLFRYQVDNQDREDRFFQKGEQFSIDTAKSQVIVWLSNAGAALMRIQGKDFELGALGEVATRKVAWRKDSDAGGYVLEITPLF